jgi:hypothetical protein
MILQHVSTNIQYAILNTKFQNTGTNSTNMLKDGGKPEEQHRTAIMHNKDK